MVDARIIRARHQMKQRLRAALDGLGFFEAPTPVRHGAGLRTCMELNLRPALEQLGSVYEIGPCFRDETPDATHLSEFEMLELFWDRPSFGQLVGLTRDLFEMVFQHPIEFEVIDLAVLLPRRYPGFHYGMTVGQLRAFAADHLGGECLRQCTRAYEFYNRLVDRLVDELAPGTREKPAMVVNYPTETVCVAKPQDGHPERIQRAEWFVGGLELAHGFVDDMDPVRLRRRMLENGPEFLDEPFLDLLASGRLPPSSGVGFGLDRLLMVQQGLGDIRSCVMGAAA